MTDLLEKVLEAHGGLDNWRRINTVDFRLTLRGGYARGSRVAACRIPQ